MKQLKCPNCGNLMAVDESNPYLSCDGCGKRYRNPDYKEVPVKTPSSNDQANPSCDSSQPVVVQENITNMVTNQVIITQQNIVGTPQKIGESKFTGTFSSYIGHQIVNYLIGFFTLGFGIPWVICRSYRWEVDHTIIDGRRLTFDGTGGQLIGSWIKWMFLTLITCGIYGLWVPLKKRAWIVEHSHIEGFAGESKFTGGLASYLGLQIVNGLIILFTLGLGVPWVVCRTIKWDSEHQIIDGQRIYFDGTAGQLFGNWIKWLLLTLVTLGFYAYLIPIKKEAWIVKHQSFVNPHGATNNVINQNGDTNNAGNQNGAVNNPVDSNRLKKCALGLGLSSVTLILAVCLLIYDIVIYSMYILIPLDHWPWAIWACELIKIVVSICTLVYFDRKKKTIKAEMASQQNPNYGTQNGVVNNPIDSNRNQLKKCALGLGVYSVILILTAFRLIYDTAINFTVYLNYNQWPWAFWSYQLITIVVSICMLVYFDHEKKAIKAEVASQQSSNSVNISNTVNVAIDVSYQHTQSAQNDAPVQPATLVEQPKRTLTCPKCKGVIVVDESEELIVCSSCGTRYKNPYYKG